MRVVDPQSAALTNIEVLSYLTSNPPRRPPNPPANVNARNFVPSPDLRDHNTVVKEINNYVTRLSPHLLRYPRYANLDSGEQQQEQHGQPGTGRGTETGVEEGEEGTVMPRRTSTDNEPTPMDSAFRRLITKLKPFGLTKAEVLMIVNMGIGLRSSEAENTEAQANGTADGEMDVDVDQQAQAQAQVPAEGEGEGEAAEDEDPDYGAKVLLDVVIEEREARLSEEDVTAILEIVRETLGGDSGGQT